MITTVVLFEFFTTYTTLDAASASTDATLSADALTVTATSALVAGNTTTRSTVSKSSGKRYFEWAQKSKGTGGQNGVGLCNTSFNNADYAGDDANSFGWYDDGSCNFNNVVIQATYAQVDTFGPGETCAVAFDADARLVWLKNLTSGTYWNADPTANPATGVGGIAVGFTGAIFGCVVTSAIGDSSTINFGSPAFVGTIPTGFSALSAASIITFAGQAVSSAVASLARQGGKAFSAATTPTKSIVHTAGKVAQATGAQVTSSIRAVAKALLGTAAQASTLTRLTNRITTRGTAAQVASIIAMKAIAKPISATAAQVASFLRSTGKNAQASGTTATSSGHAIARTISAIAAQTTSDVNAVTKTHTAASVTVAALALASIARAAMGRAITAPIGSIIHAVTRTPLTSNTTPVGSLAAQRVALFSIQGAASALGSIARTAGKGAQGASAATVSVGRGVAKMVLGAVSPLASVVNAIAHLATGASSAAGIVTRAVGKLGLRGSGAASGSLSTPRRLATLAQAASTALGSIARLPNKAAQTGVSTVSTIVKALDPALNLTAFVSVVARVLALKNFKRTPSGASRRWTLRKKSPRDRAPEKGTWRL